MADISSLPLGAQAPSLDNPNMSMLERLAKKPGIKDPKNLTDKERQEYAKAAKGFESMFVHLMMKQMKEAMLDPTKEEGSMSFGADTISGYTDLQFADYVTQSGGMGLAQMMYKHLTGGEDLKLMTQSSSRDFTSMMKLGTRTGTVKPSDALSALSDTPTNDEDTALLMASIPTKNHTCPIDALHSKTVRTMHDRIAPHIPKQTEQTTPTTSTPNGINAFSFSTNTHERIARFSDTIRTASQQYNVPEHLVRGVIASESSGKVTAQSSAGAKGLMQLMDGTAKDMGVTNVFDPVQNIHGGVKYLGQLLKQYNGDTTLALAAYNAGPGNVEKYNGVPPFPETQAYIRNVMRRSEQFKNA